MDDGWIHEGEQMIVYGAQKTPHHTRHPVILESSSLWGLRGTQALPRQATSGVWQASLYVASTSSLLVVMGLCLSRSLHPHSLKTVPPFLSSSLGTVTATVRGPLRLWAAWVPQVSGVVSSWLRCSPPLLGGSQVGWPSRVLHGAVT
jgi:hypothetical protein